MLSETLYSSGKNNFKDNTFSSREWSAPTMISPEEIRRQIDSFNLCGRKVKHMRMIGLSCFHTRNWVEEAAFRQLESLPDDERHRKSNYASIDPEMQFIRCAEVDEPLLIEFEDGDAFEIETPQEPEFCMSMNCIPWWIGAGVNQPNVNADILFSPCIGQTVASVEVNTYTSERDPMLCEAFTEFPYQRELVSNITLRFENGIGLRVGACFDYCKVKCVDPAGEYMEISFSDLKQALFNWEDLHDDEVTGFQAESATLFFGKIGADPPYMTLSSDGNRESKLGISVNDFLLLNWCITHAVNDWFDEYGEYHFSHKDWFQILDEAVRLLSFENFDALFDNLVGWNILYDSGDNGMLSNLNYFGAVFWNEREKYRTQINDLREWSSLVLNADDTMDIYGF
jgi:hypothetical protein